MNNLLARITLPWTFSRVLYLAMGGIVVIQALVDQLWFGVLFGAYFLAMGLFAWGCAGGNCTLPNNEQKD